MSESVIRQLKDLQIIELAKGDKGRASAYEEAAFIVEEADAPLGTSLPETIMAKEDEQPYFTQEPASLPETAPRVGNSTTEPGAFLEVTRPDCPIWSDHEGAKKEHAHDPDYRFCEGCGEKL